MRWIRWVAFGEGFLIERQSGGKQPAGNDRMIQDGPNRHTLVHEAMATTFKVTLVHDDPVYARQAGATLLGELDRIEGRLSRFIESSDISRINRLAGGRQTVVHLDAFDCLSIALEVQRETGGAFDAAYGSRGPWSPEPRLNLDAENHSVRVLADGVRLDLGGIGKGFTLDRMAAILADWEISAALLAASTSTVLAVGSPPGEDGWPITFGPERNLRRVRLKSRAFSGSGTAVKGSHIIDPRTQRPANGRFRAWAGAPTGAAADALSTAFMVMTGAETGDYCRRHPEVSAYALASPSAPLVFFSSPGVYAWDAVAVGSGLNDWRR
jgi:thiamine biosynthesis lipoprotein